MIYVFDASFTGALIIPDEKDKQTEKLYAKIQNEDEKCTPQLLWYEMANIFTNLVRRKRYTHDEVLAFLPGLSAMRLTTDYETGAGYAERLLRLTRDYGLTAYDAAYLELAERKRAVLCTLDGNLQKAAKKYGLKTIR